MKMVSQCVGWNGVRPIRARLVRISQCQIREKNSVYSRDFKKRQSKIQKSREKFKYPMIQMTCHPMIRIEIFPSNFGNI